MRVGRIRYHNVGQFKDVDIDLSAIHGDVIAITGDNGAGKSTFAELMLGAMYRQTPTRGSLAKLATARDGMVEVELLDSGYTVRQLVDVISGKGEASVVNADGKPQLESAKVKDYDAWSAKHLPASDVLFASSFRSQGSQGFVDLPASDRKRIVLQITQTQRFEKLAESAREQSRSAKTTAEVLRGRLADLKAKTPDVEQSKQALADAEAAADAAEKALEQARERLQAAEAAAANVVEAQKLWTRRQKLQAERDAAEATLDGPRGVTERIANNGKLLENETAIRNAATAIESQQREVEQAKAALGLANAELTRVQTALADKQAMLSRAQRSLDDARTHLADARKTLAGREAIDKAAERLIAIDELLAMHDASAKKLLAEEQERNAWLLSSKDTRIGGLRTVLQAIREEIDDEPIVAAAEALENDDANAELAQATPADIQRMRADRAIHEKAAADLRAERVRCERVAAQKSSIERAEKDVAQHERAITTLEAEWGGFKAQCRELTEQQTAAADSAMACREKVEALNVVDATAADLAAQLPKLETARARIEELTPQADQLRATITKLDDELATLPSNPPGTSSIEDDTRAFNAKKAASQAAQDAKVRCDQVVVDALRAQADIARLEEELAAAADDHADWVRLGNDLGKDGLQALVVDCALPEINELANELLHECFGPRFTIEVTSQRLSADGKRVLEDLDVMVLDTEKGRHDAIETYSGGERVILSEALSLAITAVACKANGLVRPTLVRDESGAALTAENARAWLLMLRRAVKAIGADRCLFVSHSVELQELADARIHIANGTAVIQ